MTQTKKVIALALKDDGLAPFLELEITKTAYFTTNNDKGTGKMEFRSANPKDNEVTVYIKRPGWADQLSFQEHDVITLIEGLKKAIPILEECFVKKS